MGVSVYQTQFKLTKAFILLTFFDRERANNILAPSKADMLKDVRFCYAEFRRVCGDRMV
jgi:hypothetical protein